jgi:hypothetical protein
MFRDFSFYLFSIVLFIFALFYTVPNLSTNIDNYQRETKILESTTIGLKEKTGRGFGPRIEKTLILTMTDGTEIRLNDQYQKHWNLLQEDIIIGKNITYYLGNNTKSGSNPVQLEIENFIVYNTSEGRIWAFGFFLLTLAATVYSVFGIRKYFKEYQAKNSK